MHAEARVSSVQISQRLAGHAVSVLETQGDWLHVRGDDDYDGWMHRGFVDQTGEVPPDGARRALSLGCVVRNHQSRLTRALPLGAWLSRDETVTSGQAIDDDARPTAFPRDGRAVSQTALERFAGTPYQWGGVSPWGADCSGLVQTVFWLHGVQLPRDAWQQAEVGEDAGADASGWRSGDLAFFSDREDRRVTHVGVALGQTRMVHLALSRGGYAVEQLDSSDDPYVSTLMTRFVRARRVIG
jgi:hypothetical protein